MHNNTTSMGMNRTGRDMAPLKVSDMASTAEQTGPDIMGDENAIAVVRRLYTTEADKLGSVPLPGTLSGVVQTTMAKMTGNRPEMLIDKLGERLAFERGGTRLYEAFIAKVEASPDWGPIDLERVQQFHAEEARHFKLLADAIERLGADPTAQTPCADVTGVNTLGLMQVMQDPRTTLAQCLNTLLIAELADHAGWELLINLAKDTGHDTMAAEFEVALQEELIHEQTVKGWLERMVLPQA